MSTTAQAVFERAMAIADEVGVGGTFTSSDLDEYEDRTPFILTMLEAEFLETGGTPAVYQVTPAMLAAGTSRRVRVDLPADFYKLNEVNYEDENGRFTSVYYTVEGVSTLILPRITQGRFNISYYATPSAITKLTDELHVNDVVARTILPCGLTAELFKEENEYIYQYTSARFVELKRNYRKPCTVVDAVDCYRW